MLSQYHQALNQYGIQSYPGRAQATPIKTNLAQTSDYIGLPSRTTAQSAISILTQAYAGVHSTSDQIEKEKAVERISVIVDQLPLWKDFLFLNSV
jgi:hypothetical protein